MKGIELAPTELPIFPLNTVLFPGGVLPLRVFEPRYMDMVKECMRAQTPFGVCLIERGREVGEPAVPHAVGSSARITHWDMQQLGVLQVTALGGQRFAIRERWVEPTGLARARVRWLDPEASHPVPEPLNALVPLLQAIVADAGPERMPEPHRFDDATWVGYRFSEVLPIPLLARQKLLELDDGISRLEIIRAYLAQRGLVE